MNNQQVDKIVSYYRINHHFHEPYLLLLDGNFIKLMIEKQTDFHKKLTNLIGKTYFKITSCILRQLQLLGPSFALVYQEARKYQHIRCNHPLQYGADRCIYDIIGAENQENYFVCTQDIELRRKLRNVLKLPIFYVAPDQRITMEQVQKRNKQFLEQLNRRKYLPMPSQMPQLKKYQQQLKIKEKEAKKEHIKVLSSTMGIKIKTKIPQNPNPLSVKKKKPKIDSNPPKQQNPPKTKRIRKKKEKTQAYQQQNQ